MPCLEIVMPQCAPEIKSRLAAGLTEAFDRSTRFGGEIFGIHFCEYSPGGASSGGKIWDGHNGRPYLHFKLFIPRLNHEERVNLVKAFSDVFVDVLQKPDWYPIIHICEHPYDNIGVDGGLLTQKFRELKDKRFYYDVGD